MLTPLQAPDGGPGGALRLRLRLSLPLAPAPAEALPQGSLPFDVQTAGGSSDADPDSDFASWMSVLEAMSKSFAEREGLPEDPEHPDGTGEESLFSVRRRARGREAGARAAAAEGLLRPNASDVAADVATPPSSFASAFPDDDDAAAAAAPFATSASAAYSLPPATAPFLAGGARGEELRDEDDAPDADGEDERQWYFLADLAQRQDYGSEEDDPYAMTSEDEKEQR